jgi:tetratricopeptide (TPR) repeat protein
MEGVIMLKDSPEEKIISLIRDNPMIITRIKDDSAITSLIRDEPKESIKTLIRIAEAFVDEDRLEEAMDLYKQIEQFQRQLDDKFDLSSNLSAQAWILAQRADFDEAMNVYTELQQLERKAEDYVGLVSALYSHVYILKEELNRPHDALPLAEEAYQLACVHGVVPLEAKCKSVLETLKQELKTSSMSRPKASKKWWQFWKNSPPSEPSEDVTPGRTSSKPIETKNFTGKTKKCLNCGATFSKGGLQCSTCGSQRFIWE